MSAIDLLLNFVTRAGRRTTIFLFKSITHRPRFTRAGHS